MSDDWNIKDQVQYGYDDDIEYDLEILRKKLIEAFHSPCPLANQKNTEKINKLFGVKK